MTPQVLAAMVVDRTAWEVIAPQVSAKTLTPVTGLVFAGISRYYQLDGLAEYVDVEVLGDQVVAGLANPKWAPEVKQLLSVVSDIAPTVSSKNVKEVFRRYKEDALARELAAKLASSDRSGATELMDEYLKMYDVADIEKEPELADLVAERFNKEGLMPILPMPLNEALAGGARKEHHLLVFGRPESGKSLVSINIACGLAKFGARGIFFENEDRTDDTRLRFWCNLSRMDKHQIRDNPRHAQEVAHANGIRNLRVQPLSPGTPGEIKYFVKSEKPDFIVVNQIRNLHVRAGTRTEQLERAATEMRNIAKKHGVLVLSITQAGDSATDKLILEQGDTDSSNTGIPSQMDVMLGVGLTEQYDSQDLRHLSTCKNKIGSGRRFDRAFKIDRATSRVLEPN